MKINLVNSDDSWAITLDEPVAFHPDLDIESRINDVCSNFIGTSNTERARQELVSRLTLLLQRIDFEGFLYTERDLRFAVCRKYNRFEISKKQSPVVKLNSRYELLLRETHEKNI